PPSGRRGLTARTVQRRTPPAPAFRCGTLFTARAGSSHARRSRRRGAMLRGCFTAKWLIRKERRGLANFSPTKPERCFHAAWSPSRSAHAQSYPHLVWINRKSLPFRRLQPKRSLQGSFGAQARRRSRNQPLDCPHARPRPAHRAAAAAAPPVRLPGARLRRGGPRRRRPEGPRALRPARAGGRGGGHGRGPGSRRPAPARGAGLDRRGAPAPRRTAGDGALAGPLPACAPGRGARHGAPGRPAPRRAAVRHHRLGPRAHRRRARRPRRPPRRRTAAPARGPAPRRPPRRRRARLAGSGMAGRPAQPRGARPARAGASGRPRRLADLLHDGPRAEDALDALDPGWRAAARSLEARGLLERVRLDDPAASAAPSPGPEPTPDQAEALAALRGVEGFAPVLLEGVTGSGKTEVYLQAIVERCLAHGRQALVLVPEIGLTPQMLARFQVRLGVPVHALHSGLPDGERARAWAAAWRGEARVVVGT